MVVVVVGVLLSINIEQLNGDVGCRLERDCPGAEIGVVVGALLEVSVS